jgi:hypothetical protein
MNSKVMIVFLAGLMSLTSGYALAEGTSLQQQCEESAREGSDGNVTEIQSYIDACMAEFGKKVSEKEETTEPKPQPEDDKEKS